MLTSAHLMALINPGLLFGLFGPKEKTEQKETRFRSQFDGHRRDLKKSALDCYGNGVVIMLKHSAQILYKRYCGRKSAEKRTSYSTKQGAICNHLRS